MDCKRALTEAEGDMSRAKDLLREWGIAKSEKRSGREAREGIITAYIHHSSKVGVLLELNCETDFVARTDQFRALASDIAMHIAAASPQFVTPEEISEATLEHERQICRQIALNEGKPENVIDKIVEGRMLSYFKEACLLQQPFVKDDSKTIEDLLKAFSGVIGEKLSIARFVRYQIGEQAGE